MSEHGYSWKHQLEGDPDGPLDGDAYDIEMELTWVFNSIPDICNRYLDELEGKEIGGKKFAKKWLNGVPAAMVYLCRNYNLGHFDSGQIEKYETMMLEFALLLERLKKNKIVIPKSVIEQLIAMGLLDKKSGGAGKS